MNDYVQMLLSEVRRVIPRGRRPGKWRICMPIERYRGLVMMFARGPDWASIAPEVAREIMQEKRPSLRFLGHKIMIDNGVGYYEVRIIKVIKD